MVAFTGIGGIGLFDTMCITRWEPPNLVEVLHDGALLRGTGVFEVRTVGDGSELRWSEDLRLPLGAVGVLGWALLRPVIRLGFRRSLRRFAQLTQA
jgi:hypothetical protein